jgi:hypothetical protein
MAAFALTISQPRSARWLELEHDAWTRDTAATTDYGEDPLRHEATLEGLAEVVELLRHLNRPAGTRELAARLHAGYTSTLYRLRLLRKDGTVDRIERVAPGGDSRLLVLWVLR